MANGLNKTGAFFGTAIKQNVKQFQNRKKYIIHGNINTEVYGQLKKKGYLVSGASTNKRQMLHNGRTNISNISVANTNEDQKKRTKSGGYFATFWGKQVDK